MKLYSILVYKLLFTQAPIPVCLDGTNIDISTILVTMYYYCGYVGVFFWWLRMVINISVQYSGGLLPDIILLTLLPVGNPFKYHVVALYLQPL